MRFPGDSGTVAEFETLMLVGADTIVDKSIAISNESPAAMEFFMNALFVANQPYPTSTMVFSRDLGVLYCD